MLLLKGSLTRIGGAGCVALLFAAVVAVRPSAADERWVIEPGPEATDAQKLGAKDVERAQQLAKQKKYAEAAAVLEQVSRKWPAAVHDCNLALAYLRAGAYTRAQLVWELSALRNTTRPKWCTGDVSTQLSNALRASGFVPTTIDVVPVDAVIEAGGVAFRGMRTVWLPQGQTTIVASAPGRDTKTLTTTVSAPSTKLSFTLEAPAPALPDAGVVEPVAPMDAAPVVTTTTPPADAAVTQPPPSSLITIDGKPVGRRYIALSAAVAGWVGAGVFGYLAYAAKNDANARYASDPQFGPAQDRYNAYRYATFGSLAIGAVGTALFVYFLSTEDKPIPQIGINATPDGIGIGYSGMFGDGK